MNKNISVNPENNCKVLYSQCIKPFVPICLFFKMFEKSSNVLANRLDAEHVLCAFYVTQF